MTTGNSSANLDKDLKTLKDQIEQKHGKSTEELYAEREKRVRQAINLEKPDRVPIMMHSDPSEHTDIPRSAAYYDPIAYKAATRQLNIEFEPDLSMAGLPTSGPALEALDVKSRLWPGGPLPEHYEYQFVEGEYMKADEYEIFFEDPTDFTLRYYLPRLYGVLTPLTDLPNLGYIFNNIENITGIFATPEYKKMAEALSRAGEEMNRFRDLIGDSYEELAQLGYPAFYNAGLVGGAPYDAVSSFLRGMQGAMTDMYRQPDNLLKLCDMILKRRIKQTKPAETDNRGYSRDRVGMPLWRGDKSFMSEEHFNRFYWPGLKDQMASLIDLDYIPIPFFEAEFNERLERLLELPKGRVIASVEHMDVAKATEALKGHHCVLGRGPLSHKLATVKEIEAYNKQMIDKYAGDGGFILSIRLPEKADKKELQTMIDSIKEYAKY